MIEKHLKTEHDSVHHPKHYQTHVEGLETIDIIFAILGADGFRSYCRGNALKYLSRAGEKGATAEDLKKAVVYINWEIGVLEAK